MVYLAGYLNKFFFFLRLSDQIEMGLFVLRYVSCLLMFLLGLKAPGITQNINYFTLNDSQRNFMTNQVSQGFEGSKINFFVDINLWKTRLKHI